MGVTLDEKPFLDYLTKLNISIGTEIKLLEKTKLKLERLFEKMGGRDAPIR
mgnify:CR=1 FL=1